MIHRWPHPACLDDATLLKGCVVERGRAGGPGGQHRNKVETLVRLQHEATGVEAHAGERRSQIENKGVALRRLRLALALAVRVAPPAPRGIGTIDEPWCSALWRSRVVGTRLACNPEHHDYPALLAEALDVLADCQWEPARAALRQGVSGTQIVRLISDHGPALAYVNAARQARGIRALR